MLNLSLDNFYAMTHEEIARRLGYRDPAHNGRKAVSMIQRSALRKLRQQAGAMEKLLALAALRQQIIAEKLPERSQWENS